MGKPLYIFLGFFFLGLGLVGAILPILPTVPFLLLTAYFFSKGSPRLYQWLIGLPKVGEVIQSWNEHGVISLKSKILASAAIVFVQIYLGLFREDIHLNIKVIALIVLAGVLVFIWSRPSQVRS